MTSHPLLPGSNLDTPVVSQRSKFVSKLLEAVVSALAKGSVERHEFYRNTLVEQVAPHLGLDADETRRQHVAILYAFGLDTTAEEVRRFFVLIQLCWLTASLLSFSSSTSSDLG